MTIIDAESPAHEVKYTIVAKRKGNEITRLDGQIPIKGVPRELQHVFRKTPTINIDEPRLNEGKLIVKLPAILKDVAIGGGGRYMVLHLPTLRKLAVFDVSVAKIVKYLPAPAERVAFAANADKLIVVLPEQKMIERWNLRTSEKELAIPVPGIPEKDENDEPAKMGVTLAAMGSNSTGPLLLCSEAANVMIDVQTMRAVHVPGLEALRLVFDREPHIRASEDGRAYTVWHTRKNIRWEVVVECMQLLTLEAGAANLVFGNSLPEKVSGATCFCSPGTFRVFHSKGGVGKVYSPELKQIPVEQLQDASLLPVGNSYVVAVRLPARGKKLKNATIAVHEANTFSELFRIDGLTEMNDASEIELTFEKRFHFVPAANVLVTMPKLKDRLVVRRIAVDEALAKSGLDYLIITTAPNLRVMRGQKYSYQMAVKSPKGRAAYTLDSGPDGMKLSEAGLLTWDVPDDHPANSEAVIITVSDASGKEIFHTFDLAIRPGVAE